MTVDPAALLGSVPLLAGLPREELENLAALSEPFAIAAGEVLFEEGDPSDSVFVIGSGQIEFLKRLPGDRALTAARLGPGTTLGELAMLAGVPRVATVRAAAATSGLAVDARAVQQLLTGTDPGARELGRRLGQQALSTLRSLIDRIAAALEADPHASEPPRPLTPPAVAPAPVDPEPGESDYLRTILFFNRFTAAQLDALFGGLRRLAAPRGTELVAADARPGALLFVLRGAVESTLRRGCAAARVRLSGPGRIVTHLGVLDGGTTPYVCRARERAVLLEVPTERFAGLDAGTDAAARLFWHGVFQDVADAIVHAERPLARMAAARQR